MLKEERQSNTETFMKNIIEAPNPIWFNQNTNKRKVFFVFTTYTICINPHNVGFMFYTFESDAIQMWLIFC